MTSQELINHLAKKDYFISPEGLKRVYNNKSYVLTKDNDDLILNHYVNLTNEGINTVTTQLQNLKNNYKLSDINVQSNNVSLKINEISDNLVEEEERMNHLIMDLDRSIYEKANNLAVLEDGSLGSTNVEVSVPGFSPVGVLGALIGSVVGALAIALVARVGFFASFLGALAGYLIVMLYEKLSKKIIPTPLLIVFILLTALLGSIFTNAAFFMRDVPLGEALNISMLCHFNPSEAANYVEKPSMVWKDFALITLFTFLGASSMLRSNKGQIKND